MRHFKILLIPFLVFGCKNMVKDKKVQTKPGGSREVEAVSRQSSQSTPQPTLINEEFIDWDSVRLNEKLPMISSTKEFINLLGAPDSIVTPDMSDVCVSFFDKSFKYAYLNNTQIEIYKDTAVVRSIDLRRGSSLTLKTPKVTLGASTSLKSLEKLFPNAVMEQYEVNMYGIGKATAVSIPPSKELSDDSWVLFFINGQLVRIDYFMPC